MSKGNRISVPGKPTLLAVPGSPTKYLQAPQSEVDAALEKIRQLAEEMAKEELFGFLEPPRARARWEPCFHQEDGYRLRTSINHPEAWVGSHRTIDWRWGVLWENEEWWEPGWHPDINYAALRRPWARKLWVLLNPKRGPAPR